MKRCILCVCAMLLIAGNVFSESVYTWDLKKDLIIGGISLGLFVPTFFLDSGAGDTISKDDINGLDRQLMYSYKGTMDTVSSALAYGLLVLPGISLLGNITDLDAVLTYGIMYTEAFLLTYATKDLLKFAVKRNRPYTYFGDIPSGEEDDYYNSFPSGHTSFAFLGATFLTTTFVTEYPESKWKIPVIAGSYAMATGIAAMRIFSGNHFITDVLAGAAIGSFYGWFIPWIHRKPKSIGNTQVAFNPLPMGMMVTLSF
ncbi:phosphatase PAP2 family protein [Breznakiella homolactica]|uniref:Phosphatase PAP2 family protein n=1 Tax=Breznakiella homolactica TaxID=2798577 RepID=A0A7T7XL09_9SPIR|nr:phosphatase PAP2 family protein [Breznakiella homolactica]QQO08354.1 phosphatase PAP2 family protein [Breznakiella homolactica]